MPVFAKTPEEIDAQIHAKEAEIRKLREDRAKGLDYIPQTEQQLAILDMCLAEVKPKYDQTKRQIGELKVKLRQLDEKIAKLASVGDWVRMWSEYKEAGKTEEAFITLFTKYYGRRPDSTDIETQGIQALIIERQIRGRTAAYLGPAFVALGKLVLEIPSLALGVGTNSSQLHKASEGVSETLSKYTDWIGDYVPKITDFLANTRLDKLNLTAAGAVGKVGVKTTFTYLNAEKFDTLIRDFNKALYGTEDRAEAVRVAKWMKEHTSAELERAEENFQKTKGIFDDLEAAKAYQEGILNALKKEVADQEAQIAGLELDIDNLHVEHDLAVYQQQVAKAGGAAVYPTSIGLQAGGGPLAADSVTANVLGFRRNVTFRTPASLTSPDRETCTYSETTVVDKRTGQTRTVQKKAVRQILRSLGGSPDYPKSALALDKAGVVLLDNNRRHIIGRNPGTVNVRATARGVVNTQPVSHPCGSETQYSTGTLTSGNSSRFTVQKITKVHYTGPDETDMSSRTIDLFVSDETGTAYGSLRIGAEVDVSNGQSVERMGIRRESFHPIFLGGIPAGLKVSKEPGFVTIEPQWANYGGKTNLNLGLEDLDGNRHFQRTLTITSNRVSGDVEMPILLPDKWADCVPIGEAVKYRIDVVGGGSMSKYAVRWPKGEGLDLQETTNFATVTRGGQWSSTNEVRFTTDRIVDDQDSEGIQVVNRKPYYPVAEVIRKADNKVVYRHYFPSIRPILPRLVNFELAMVGKGAISVLRADYFIPSEKKELTRLGLIAEFSEIGKRTLKLAFAQTRIDGTLSQVASLDHDGLLTFTASLSPSYYDAGTEMVGNSMVIASLDFASGIKRGVVLMDADIQDQLMVGLNKLVVDQVGEGKEKKHRLKVYGPAPMEGFTAQWHFLGNMEEKSEFSKMDTGYVSYARGDRPFIEVEVLNTAGQVVARYSRFRDGEPLPEPRIQLSMPPDTAPGSKVVVTADIENLHNTDADDFYCEWDVDPVYGEFSPNPSRVGPTSPTSCSCNSTLSVKDDSNIVGKDIPLRVKLLRNIGGKGE